MNQLTIPRGFEEAVFVDFEFSQPSGSVPKVVCASALEAVSGRDFRMMLDGAIPSTPPWRTDKRCLYVGYSLAAEMSCHLSLGWEMPAYLLDLYFEFRYLTNDFQPSFHRGLVHACLYHNLRMPTDRLLEKTEMRQLAIHWYERDRHDYERKEIQDYCREDVTDTMRLYEAMYSKIDFGPCHSVPGALCERCSDD